MLVTIDIYPLVDCANDGITENCFWLGACKDAAVVQQEYRDTPDPSPHGVLHFLPRQCRLVWIVHQTDDFFGGESMPRGNRRKHFGLANIFCVEKICGKERVSQRMLSSPLARVPQERMRSDRRVQCAAASTSREECLSPRPQPRPARRAAEDQCGICARASSTDRFPLAERRDES